jgi:hypothetical protein
MEADAELGQSDQSTDDEGDGQGPGAIRIDNLGASMRMVARGNNYSPRPSKAPPPIVPPLRIGSPPLGNTSNNGVSGTCRSV